MNTIEIEFKTMLTKQEFHQLLTKFNLKNEDCYWQKNTYLDTSKNELKNNHFSLRIREFKEKAEQTLKIPTKNGKLEITDFLALATLSSLYQKETIKSPSEVSKALKSHFIDLNDLSIIGELETYRYEILSPIGLLAIDHSIYYGQEDFELELEVFNYEKSKKDFQQFLKDQALLYQPSKSKIQRAIEGKNVK